MSVVDAHRERRGVEPALRSNPLAKSVLTTSVPKGPRVEAITEPRRTDGVRAVFLRGPSHGALAVIDGGQPSAWVPPVLGCSPSGQATPCWRPGAEHPRTQGTQARNQIKGCDNARATTQRRRTYGVRTMFAKGSPRRPTRGANDGRRRARSVVSDVAGAFVVLFPARGAS